MNIKLDEKGLVPAIAQDYKTGQVLMLGYMNPGSLKRTLEVGRFMIPEIIYLGMFSQANKSSYRGASASSLSQLLPDYLGGNTGSRHQHQGVVEQVRHLTGHSFLITCHRSQSRFAGFFDDLLGDTADPFLEQARSIATLRRIRLSIFDNRE